MRALAFVLLLAAAGCVQPSAAPAATLQEAQAPELAALGLTGTGCREGGGHSVHPSRVFNPLPAPWVPADVLADVGPQLTYSEFPDPERPVPEEGRTMGNYHATVLCDAWTFRGVEKPDLLLGFVGMKVERPEWSDEAPTHHYLVTVVATNDDDVYAALVEGGVHAMRATASWEELGADVVRIRMWTDENGSYDSLVRLKPYGEMQATHVRLWFLASLDGDHEHAHDQGSVADGEFRPIALDLLSSGGEHLVADAQGYFSHAGTGHHWPLPGAHGHTAAIVYRGFDRTVDWGPRPDLVLHGAYVH